MPGILSAHYRTSTARRGRLNMGTWNYLWHFILSVFLCTRTGMALEERGTTITTPGSHVNVLRSTNNREQRTGPDANSSDASTAEPSTQTAHSLLGTSSLSPSTMRTVGGDGKMNTTPTTPAREEGSSGMSARSPALPTAGPGTTAASPGTESGTASSLPLSSAVTSHSFSSSSPEGSSAVTPSPQQSSTSGTTETPLATTSHPPTALVFSSPSSPAGSAVTAEAVTQGPTTPRPVASTSSTSPASGTIEDRLSSTLGRSTETWTAELTSTPLTHGQAMVEVTATSSPMGSPLPSVNTAPVGSSATIPPGEGESSTMNQGSGMTTDPNVQTSHSLPATSLVSLSTMRTVSEEGRTDITLTTPAREGSSLGTSPGSGAVSPALPTAGPGTTAASPGTESGTASSLPLSSAVTSHSSSSSSPKGSAAVTPSPQQSSTSGTTETPLATTSHPPTALVFSSPSSPAGITGTESDTVTAEPIMNSPAPSTPSTNPVASTSGTPSVGSSAVTPSPQQSSTSGTTETPLAVSSHPSTALVLSSAGVTGVESGAVTAEEVTPSPALSTASTNPVASAPITSPASGITESMHSPTLSSSTETPVPRHTSPLLTQGHTTVEVTATSSPMGSPLSSITTAPVGSSATTPPGDGESSTMNQGSRTTAEPTAKTSHSLSSTTLASPSTTNHSISTSVNPSFPGTCLPVSVEVQNITAEEIHLSWTSGSKGSIYNISFGDGNQEINKTTTEETKAVFKHLLPGHVYTISVAVSSCAENNQTSVTVRTDPASCFETTELCLAENTGCSELKGMACSKNQAFACSIVLKSQIFNNTLYNSESEDYQTLAGKIKTDVVADVRAELNNDRFDIVVLGFRPGSVVVDFLSLLPKEEPVDIYFIWTSLTKILRNKFGNETKVIVQPLSVQPSTDNYSSWRVAVIVLGVLLGVALVLILLAILFYIYVRRRSGMEFFTLYTW
ncbi:uncharacterized protein [Aphelocoma coerulescens]|uniref:uncharacterized protein isoform X2 n=1 Tax=Aphelocoma coerulescens TaxID=39617 RepID=UPI003604C53C